MEAGTLRSRHAIWPHGIDGRVYTGLCIECIADDGGGIWFDDWDVTHLASGLRIGTISGLDEARPTSWQPCFADLTEWNVIASPDQVSELAADLMNRLLILSDQLFFTITGIAQSPWPVEQ